MMREIGLMKRVLLVAEDPGRSELQEALVRLGFEVLAAGSRAEVLHILERHRIGCVLADLRTGESGAGTLVASLIQKEPALAVVALTRDADLETALACIRSGAMDCVAEADGAAGIEAAIGRVTDIRLARHREELIARTLREEVGRLTGELRRERARAEDLAFAALESLVCVVEAKDPWLGGHSIRVAQLAASLAAEIRRSDEEIELVRVAGRLHDIGMICIGEGILSKEGPLTPAEFEQVKRHVLVGCQILSPLPGLAAVGSFVRHHHERWDGGGYPDGLAGDAIPWGACLISAAEIYDALTSARPYREAIAPDLAVEHMRRGSGTTISPVAFAALEAVVERHGALEFVNEVSDEVARVATELRGREVDSGPLMGS
jgi:response regulator RpfG family c-di-GMP phosphodiesterase